MRDAVVITRNLGLKYLWINALCIVQDDVDDWKREALSMGEVYAQSAITIAASSSPDGDGGCFLPRVQGPTAQLLWSAYDGVSELEKVSFRRYDPWCYQRLVEEGPLNKRAWVLQERGLSRRIVHFTAERLFLECQRATLTEGMTKINRTVSHPRNNTSPRTFSHPLASVFQNARDTSEALAGEEAWYRVVERYSPAQLTNKTDRLPALAGLAMAWGATVMSADRYIAGCWQENLPMSLLWTRHYRRSGSDDFLPYPSWSWASLDGDVSFIPEEWGMRPYYAKKTFIEDIVVTVDGSTTDKVYGNIGEGLLTLTGRVKSAIFSGERNVEELENMPWTMMLDVVDDDDNNMNDDDTNEDVGYDIRHASFDRRPPPSYSNSPIPILQLCSFHKDKWVCEEFVMLLEPLPQRENHFKRLGLGKITSIACKPFLVKGWKKHWALTDHTLENESWFADAPKVRLTIV
jgi:hypothetical protein